MLTLQCNGANRYHSLGRVQWTMTVPWESSSNYSCCSCRVLPERGHLEILPEQCPSTPDTMHSCWLECSSITVKEWRDTTYHAE